MDFLRSVHWNAALVVVQFLAWRNRMMQWYIFARNDVLVLYKFWLIHLEWFKRQHSRGRIEVTSQTLKYTESLRFVQFRCFCKGQCRVRNIITWLTFSLYFFVPNRARIFWRLKYTLLFRIFVYNRAMFCIDVGIAWCSYAVGSSVPLHSSWVLGSAKLHMLITHVLCQFLCFPLYHYQEKIITDDFLQLYELQLLNFYYYLFLNFFCLYISHNNTALYSIFLFKCLLGEFRISKLTNIYENI